MITQQKNHRKQIYVKKRGNWLFCVKCSLFGCFISQEINLWVADISALWKQVSYYFWSLNYGSFIKTEFNMFLDTLNFSTLTYNIKRGSTHFNQSSFLSVWKTMVFKRFAVVEYGWTVFLLCRFNVCLFV